ncbi:MAG: DUF4363 family protein [Clostridia bacterium]|nr:DUF4363 family protein [Clostridia bacterium]
MHSVKVLSSVAIIIAMILGISFFTMRTLRITSEELDSHIIKVEDSIKAGDWEKAKEELKNVEDSWSRTEKTWTKLLDHFEIDNIDTTLIRLSRFIDSNDKPLALGEAAALKQYVNHIPEKESLLLKNIF